jgi:hypothetical protein
LKKAILAIHTPSHSESVISGLKPFEEDSFPETIAIGIWLPEDRRILSIYGESHHGSTSSIAFENCGVNGDSLYVYQHPNQLRTSR